jgi:formate dehydrogenase (NADP+) beta subunit
MLEATLFLLLLGLSSSVLLAIASRVFYVKEDPRVLDVTDALPAANCGGCGYAGCASYAEAVAGGKAPPNLCVVGGFETAKQVAGIMGQTVTEREPELAWSSCNYGTGEADLIFDYNGAIDCRAAVLLYGGSKECPIGCIGLGSCVKACDFEAVEIGDENLPVFNKDRCVACGACVEACPKDIILLTSATKRIINEYTTDECTAPCQRACPTGIDIPAYIAEIRKGNYEEGLRIIKEKCPLPLICGRICPAPCEFDCRRNYVDDTVAINPLKRFLADYEMETGKHINPYKCQDSGHRTAVIGGGSEGLTASYYLARLGHQPTIIEAKPELGGILRYVISEDRLPRNVLDHEIKGILEMGVEARTGKVMTRDYTISSLFAEGFDTIAVTAGGFDSRKILRPGDEYLPIMSSLILMIDYLRAEAAGKAPSVSGNVAIVEGLGKALETARACLKQGAAKVTIVSNKPLESFPEELQETETLKAEGIDVRPETIVSSLGGKADKLMKGSLLKREAFKNNGAESEVIKLDYIILGAPRYPELVLSRMSNAEELTEAEEYFWQTVETYKTLPGGGDNGIFSTPEKGRLSDSTAVIKSIMSGRRVARGIQQFFEDGEICEVNNLAAEADEVLNTFDIENVESSERISPHSLPPESGTENNWIDSDEIPGPDEKKARAEAERCLECGLICYKKKEPVTENVR